MDVDSMSMKELKALIAKAGLSFADCVEKSDIKARAREAAAALEKGLTRPSVAQHLTGSVGFSWFLGVKACSECVLQWRRRRQHHSEDDRRL